MFIGRRLRTRGTHRVRSNPGTGVASTLAGLIFAALAAGGPAAAQPAPDPQVIAEHTAGLDLVGQSGGPIMAMATRGDFAYVAVGARVVVLDLAAWPDHRALGESPPLADLIVDVAERDGFVYVATDAGDLLALDVRDPARPRQVGEMRGPPEEEGAGPPAWPPVALDVEGHLAYLAFGDMLRVVDLEDPAAPRVVGELRVGVIIEGAVADADAAGRYVWLAAGEDGIRVVDVADPAAPRVVAAYDRWVANAIAVAGDHAYVAVEESVQATRPGNRSGGLLVLDARDPLSAEEAGMLWLPDVPTHVGVSGDLAFASIGGWPSGASTLAVIDVARPAEPRLVAARDADVGFALHVDGSRVFVLTRPDELAMVEIRPPAAPARLGVYTPWAGDGGNDRTAALQVAGRYAWVAAGPAGVRVLDVGDPARPREVGAYTPGWPAAALALAGDHVVVSAGGAGIRVLDGRDPRAPREVGRLVPPWRAGLIRAGGRYAYVGDDRGGLHVVDVGDPAAPREAGSVRLPLTALGVAVFGNHAFVATGRGGLRVVDVADPRAPREVGALTTAGGVNLDVQAVDVAGGFAFLAEGRRRLWAVDVSDPSRPRALDALAIEGAPSAYPLGVQVVDTTVLVAVANMGLQLVDARDPAALAPLGRLAMGDDYSRSLGLWATPGRAYLVTPDPIVRIVDWRKAAEPETLGVYDPVGGPFSGGGALAVSGDHAFATGWDGLRIFDVRDPSRPFPITDYAIADTTATSVAVVGDVAIVGTEERGLMFLDVRDPEAPVEIGRSGDMSVASLRVSGGRLFAAMRDRGLRVFHVGDPAAPRALGAFGDGEVAVESVDVAGDHAYVLGEDLDDGRIGLYVVDVRGSAKPTAVGVVDLDFADRYGATVAVAGDHAYVAHYGGPVHVVDIRDPAAPRLVKTPWRIWERVRAVPGHSRWLVSLDDFGAHVLDAGDPARPAELDAAPAEEAMDTALADGLLYVLDGDGGLTVHDLRDPAGPHPTGRFTSWIDGRRLAVAGGQAYVGSLLDGVRIIDVRAPDRPADIGRYLAPDVLDILIGRRVVQGVSDVAVDAGRAYVVRAGALDVVDVSDPGGPRLLGGFDLDAGSDVLVADAHAYIWDSARAQPPSLRILDVGDPAAIAEAGRINLPVERAAVDGGFAFLATDSPSARLQVVDVRDPRQPALLASADLPTGDVNALAVAAGRAYVVTNQSRLRVFDVAEPAAPRARGTFELNLSVLAAQGERLFAASRDWSEMRLLQARGDGTLGEVATRAHGSDWRPIALATDERGLLYVLTLYNGLWIYRVTHHAWLPVAWNGRGGS